MEGRDIVPVCKCRCNESHHSLFGKHPCLNCDECAAYDFSYHRRREVVPA